MTTAATSEQEKMADRLLHGPVRADGSRQPGYKLRHFNAWWGDNPPADPEARAAAVNRVLAQFDAGETTVIPSAQLD